MQEEDEDQWEKKRFFGQPSLAVGGISKIEDYFGNSKQETGSRY
jgi:hypothetical protein